MWQEKNNCLYREFMFQDFKRAFLFMQSVAAEAEQLNHHPRWENDYNRVQIWLSTHDSGNIVTDLDKKLARLIDKIYDVGEMEQSVEKNTTQVTEIKLYTDGGSRGNPGPSAGGYVLMNSDNNILVKRGVYLGVTTNNQAEYKALKLGLEEVLKKQIKHVDVYMDSLLIVNQMLGNYKVKNNDLRPIYDEVNKLIRLFDQTTFTHIPRELNKIADDMVNKALDKELKI